MNRRLRLGLNSKGVLQAAPLVESEEREIMAGLEAWAGWQTHVLVLLSFALQVTLVVLADIRRRVKSSVLSSMIWTAYMLADTTAVYALGHFSVTTGLSVEHELMALWAPLLLVHLGGPDNITAYAVEDNRLWLRHLQSFGLQSVAAAYVLYQSSLLSRPTWLRASAILMLIVGVLKYGERVWALKLASSVHSSALLRFHGGDNDDDGDDDGGGEVEKKVYRAIQAHLSEMYGVFYSKAKVMCTWPGFFIRVISLVFAVAVFLTFHLSSDKDKYNRVDVTATYTLLIGLLVLDVTSVLRFILSTAPKWLLEKSPENSWRESLGGQLESMKESWRHKLYCSGTMRQLDLFHFCTRMRDSRRGRTVRWMGWCGRWIRLDFSWSIPVMPEIIKILLATRCKQLFPGCEEDIATLVPEIKDRIRFLAEMKMKLGERILVWHIATHVLLNSPQRKSSVIPSLEHLAKAVRVLSNYTIFLLAEHAHLLSDLSFSLNDPQWMLVDLATMELQTPSLPSRSEEDPELTLLTGRGVGNELIKVMDYKLFEAMTRFWVHVLKTVEETLGEDFHVKQLSNGGEFLTILSILVKRERPTRPSNQV